MNVLMLFTIFCGASAVIYQLNDTEYYRMPPIFHLDPYESCIHRKGLYCSVQIDLVAEDDSELMNIILEYSMRKETHFNHTRLSHGICISNKCNNWLNVNATKDLKLEVEGCLNDTFWNEYKLRTRLNEDPICSDGDAMKLEPADIAAAVVFICLILLNVIGNLYDFFIVKNNDEANRYLLCFSIKRNWIRLTEAPGNNAEPQSKCLRGLNGLKAITILLVLVEHSPLTFVVALDNPYAFEKMFDNLIYHILLDGAVAVQTFFIISGCLLAYQLQKSSEKENLSWKMIPKLILYRYLRLTPTYTIVLIFTMTWIRFSGSGPFWQKTIRPEVRDCRRYGWMNLIYINNYYDNTQCMAHTWYLAADMQLYILGVFTLVLAKTDYARKVALSLLFVVTFSLPAFHTYFQNLHAHIILAPEVARGHFIKDPTFNNSYKRGHLNLPCFIIGISLGLLIYQLQKRNFNIMVYKKYKCFYWAILPALIGIILLSSIFYMDGVSPPLTLKAIYSCVLRPAYGLLLFFLIIGMAFKFENIYRSVLEWKGWSAPSRISYSAYLLHMALIQVATGSRATLFHASPLQNMIHCVGTSISTFALAFLFWLLVEGPLKQLAKIVHRNRKMD